jgi:hypothetical protein
VQVFMRMATAVAVFGAAIAGGIAGAHVLGGGHDGISREQAIAIAQREIQPDDPQAELIAARSGRYDKFWYPGSTGFSVPSAQRVWAVAFRGTFSVSCGPPTLSGEQQQCPPPHTAMMVIIDYRDGAFIESSSPVYGFEGTYPPEGSAIAIGVIPEGTDFCPLDALSQSGFLVSVPDPSGMRADGALRPLLLEPAPAGLASLGLDTLWVARSDDPAQLPPGSTAVPLDLLAHDPLLHSCDYHLADKPLARILRDDALTLLADQGIATEQELNQPSVVWMISDSDLPEGAVAVYTLLQWPQRVPPRSIVMTVFDRNWNLLGAVPVNLYAADDEPAP